jgi:hypothetical protein
LDIEKRNEIEKRDIKEKVKKRECGKNEPRQMRDMRQRREVPLPDKSQKAGQNKSMQSLSEE